MMLCEAADWLTQQPPYLWHLTEVCKATSAASESVATKGVRRPENICDSQARRWSWSSPECLWKENRTTWNPKPHFFKIISSFCLFRKGPARYFQRGEQPFNFPWPVSKKKKNPWKAELWWKLTYASDQLIKGVSWRSVHQNCAWAVFWSGAVCRLTKKNSTPLKVTVKKQNIVTEYVCCKRRNTRDPIHVKCIVCFFFMHRNSARGYSCPCVLLKSRASTRGSP